VCCGGPVGLPGLPIAAAAERERVTVLHYDGDFELIAHVTAQPSQWVVPPERFLDLSEWQAQSGQRTARGQERTFPRKP
jgi:hypothetical protein